MRKHTAWFMKAGCLPGLYLVYPQELQAKLCKGPWSGALGVRGTRKQTAEPWHSTLPAAGRKCINTCLSEGQADTVSNSTGNSWNLQKKLSEIFPGWEQSLWRITWGQVSLWKWTPLYKVIKSSRAFSATFRNEFSSEDKASFRLDL